MYIGRICRREPDVVGKRESVADGLARMVQRRVEALVVVDRGGIPLGVVTQEELVRYMIRRQGDLPVSEVMTHRVELVGERTTLEQALDLMRRAAVRWLAVVDPSARFVGVVTLDALQRRLSAPLTLVPPVLQGQGAPPIGEVAVAATGGKKNAT